MSKNNARKRTREILKAAKNTLTGANEPKVSKRMVKARPLPKVQSVPNPLDPSEQMLSDAWEKQAKKKPKPKSKPNTSKDSKPTTKAKPNTTKVNVSGKGKTPTSTIKAKDLGANQPTLKWLKTKVVENLPSVARTLGWAGTAAKRGTAIGAIYGAIVPEKKFVDRSGYSDGVEDDYEKMQWRNSMADPSWGGGKFGTVGKLTSAPSSKAKKLEVAPYHGHRYGGTPGAKEKMQATVSKVTKAQASPAPAPLNTNNSQKAPYAKKGFLPPKKPDAAINVAPYHGHKYGGIPGGKSSYEPSGPMERDNSKSLKAYRDWAGSKLEKPDAFSQGLSNLLGVKVTPGHQVPDPEGGGGYVMKTSPHAKHSSKHPVAALQEQKERKKKGWSNTAFPQK